jgi:hypothetical protein
MQDARCKMSLRTAEYDEESRREHEVEKENNYKRLRRTYTRQHPCLPPSENSFNVHSQQLSSNSLALFLERPKARSALRFSSTRCFENLLSGEIWTKLTFHDSFDSFSRIFSPLFPTKVRVLVKM